MMLTEAVPYSLINQPEQYNYSIIRQFTVTALVCGILGMVVGVYLAIELIWPYFNFNLAALSFGRLRPVHTTLTVFGFAGNILFATSYYVVQRTCQVRLLNDRLTKFTFFGWQAVILLGVVTELSGYTQAREYAEFEWPIDLLVEVVWLVYLWVYITTLHRRNQPHIYVANWFYLACLLGMILSETIENLAVPVTIFGLKSYSRFSGVQDAMIQWWYGHNVMNFLLNMAFLGIMYYFIPKQAGRPLYSYRLSIIHFWSLILLSVWMAPNHLYWTALPDWTVTLGVTFSIMLWWPSWAGVINGLMTLSGAWDRLRVDPVLRFLIFALLCYGLTTLEGGLMSFRTINALFHYTDWIIGHAHLATQGWVAMMSFGVIYHLVPRLWNTKLYSIRSVSIHFWLAVAGITLHAGALAMSGIVQGQRLHAIDEYGNLVYGFMETDIVLDGPYLLRIIGGVLFLLGVVLMVHNIFVTITRIKSERAAIEARITAKLAIKGRPT
ncbi:Cytochrome c oxidase subunit 1 homolog, bacteroid [Gammaproteobacteria bacterium]